MNDWAAFQKQLSAIITQPLSVEGQVLKARPATIRGWETYNRMYWIRLFRTLQEEFPLLARLMGYWSFNQLVQEYIVRHPPETADLQDVALALPQFLMDIDRPLYFIQAARMDAARSQVFLAPAFSVWQLTPEAAERLEDIQLRAAPSWRLVVEDWALLDLYNNRASWPASEAAMACPDPWPEPQCWLIRREDRRLIQQRLPPAQAEFYRLLSENSIGRALSLMSEQCPQLDLPPLIQQWLAQSMGWELWMDAQAPDS